MDDGELNRLRRAAASSGDYRDMLAYRNALKRSGNRRADLDIPLLRKMAGQYKWEVVGADRNESYGAVRQLLLQLCADDGGYQPFLGRDARPLTFKETIQARLDQWRASGGKDWSLWTTWLDSCTGIVWEAGGRRFKIVPMSAELLNAPASRAEYLTADFANTPGVPLTVDSTYNRDLTPEEVVKHEGWLAAVEGDSALLQEYVAVAFGRMGRTQAMQFWAERQGLPDHLRPLCAINPVYSYGAGGGRDLCNDARFVRVRPL